MSEPVLVRGARHNRWQIALAVLGLLGAVAGAVLLGSGGRGERAAGRFVAAVGGLIAAGAVLWAVARARRRRWVVDTGTGFIVTDRRGERAYRDDQVLTFALVVKQNYSQGLPTSRTRRFFVWLLDEDATERLEIANTLKQGQADPLAGLIDRLNERLWEQAVRDLKAGRSVLGEGWSLEKGELTVHAREAEPVVLPLADVVAAETVDDHLCIWRRGADAAVARVPMDSANAYLLARLLGEELARRPADDEPPPEGQLGRIVFERKARRETRWLVAAVALLAAIIGLGMLAAGGDDALIGVAVCGAVVACCVLGLVHLRRSVFRCHAWGVCKAGLFGEQMLRFDQVREFTYSAVRWYHNGVYTGTHLSMKLDPIDPSRHKTFSYQVQVRNADEQLDHLRDHIARVLAGRMAQQLNAGEPVVWTPNLRFLPGKGIEHRPAGWFGRKEPVVIPYEAIRGFNLDQGTFFLWVHDEPKPAVKEDVTRPNFFPGFFLLTMMTAATARNEPTAPAAGAAAAEG